MQLLEEILAYGLTELRNGRFKNLAIKFKMMTMAKTLGFNFFAFKY